MVAAAGCHKEAPPAPPPALRKTLAAVTCSAVPICGGAPALTTHSASAPEATNSRAPKRWVRSQTSSLASVHGVRIDKL